MRASARTVGIAIALLMTACSPQSGQIACTALRSAPYAQELNAYHAFQPGAALPRTTDEAIAALDHTLTPAQKAQVRCAADATELHFTLGRWIRNEWGVYDKSALARDMIGKGFIDPDDMSSALITAYAQHLRGGHADFAALAVQDRAYWTKRGVDVDAELQQLSQ